MPLSSDATTSASAAVLFIFQFPATIFFLMIGY
jgi:hypothetical protein